MEFSRLIAERYSVRAYKPDPIEQDKLERVLEAARLAPTAVNFQPFQLMVIQTAGREDELNRIYRKDWFVQPPLVVAVCGLHDRAWTRRDGRSFLDIDVAIVMDHLILAATDEGLGTCWIGNFDAGAAREVLGLPDDVEPIVFTPLGYPDDKPKAKKRRPLSELVRYERW